MPKHCDLLLFDEMVQCDGEEIEKSLLGVHQREVMGDASFFCGLCRIGLIGLVISGCIKSLPGCFRYRFGLLINLGKRW